MDNRSEQETIPNESVLNTKELEMVKKRKRKQYLGVAGIFVAVIAVSASSIWYYFGTRQDSEKELSDSAFPENDNKAGRGGFGGNDIVSASGTTAVGMEAVVFAIDFLEESSLIVEEVYLDNGDFVAAGDKYIQFTSDSIESARAELENAVQSADLAYRSMVISNGESRMQAKYTYDTAKLEAEYAEQVYQDALAQLDVELAKAETAYTEAQEAYNDYYYAVENDSFYTDYQIEKLKKAYEDAYDLFINRKEYWEVTEEELNSSSAGSGSGVSGMGENASSIGSSVGSSFGGNENTSGSNSSFSESTEKMSFNKNDGITINQQIYYANQGSLIYTERLSSEKESLKKENLVIDKQIVGETLTDEEKLSKEETVSEEEKPAQEESTEKESTEKESTEKENTEEGTKEEEKPTEKETSSEGESSTDKKPEGQNPSDSDKQTEGEKPEGDFSINGGNNGGNGARASQNERQWIIKTVKLLQEEADEAKQEYEQAQQEYEDELEGAELKLQKLLNQLETAREDYTDASVAYQKASLSAKTTYEMAVAKGQTAKNDYDTQLASYADALERLKDAKDKAEENKALFEELVGDGYLYTENAGTVFMIQAKEGQALSGGDRIFAYSNAEKMTVSVSVSQEEIAKLSIGENAAVMVSDYGNFSGVIEAINPIASSDSRTSVSYTVTVALEGDVSKLSPNLAATVVFGENNNPQQTTTKEQEGNRNGQE